MKQKFTSEEFWLSYNILRTTGILNFAQHLSFWNKQCFRNWIVHILRWKSWQLGSFWKTQSYWLNQLADINAKSSNSIGAFLLHNPPSSPNCKDGNRSTDQVSEMLCVLLGIINDEQVQNPIHSKLQFLFSNVSINHNSLKNMNTFLLNGKHPLFSGSGMASMIKSIVGVLLGPNTLSSLKHSVSIICNAKWVLLLKLTTLSTFGTTLYTDLIPFTSYAYIWLP